MAKYGMIQFIKADLPLVMEAFHRMWLVGTMKEFAAYMQDTGWLADDEIEERQP